MRNSGVANARVVDLFCGVGGLSHGFFQEGFDIAAGVDVDPVCEYAFKTNNKSRFLLKSVSEVTGADLAKYFGTSKQKILIGCAPCQPFSTYNQKNSDERWKLLEAFADIICEIKPEIVSMENVPRLAEFNGGALLASFTERLIDTGYSISSSVLYGPDYGLPQTRSRFVLLASLGGQISLPKPTHRGRYRTVRDAIGSLPPVNAGQCSPNDRLHRASRLTEINKKRIASSRPGGTWKDWEIELRAPCHRKETGKTYSGVYGRMEWDKPSPTMTTQFYGFGNGRFGHPEQDRALTLREGAILQGFPKGYKFVNPSDPVHTKTVGRLIGNAVPVTLARAIAKAIASHLE